MLCCVILLSRYFKLFSGFKYKYLKITGSFSASPPELYQETLECPIGPSCIGMPFKLRLKDDWLILFPIPLKRHLPEISE